PSRKKETGRSTRALACIGLHAGELRAEQHRQAAGGFGHGRSGLLEPGAEPELRAGDVEGGDDPPAEVPHGCGGGDEAGLELLVDERVSELARLLDPAVELRRRRLAVGPEAHDLDVCEQVEHVLARVAEEKRPARRRAVGGHQLARTAARLARVRTRLRNDLQLYGA